MIDPATLRLYLFGSEYDDWKDLCESEWEHRVGSRQGRLALTQGEMGMDQAEFEAITKSAEPRVALAGQINANFRIKGCGKTVPVLNDKYFVSWGENESVHLFTVTASSPEEEKAMQEFLEGSPADLRELIEANPRLFSAPDREPPARAVKHRICVPWDFVPTARNAYPLATTKLEAMRTQVGELVEKGWVVPSESPWAAPILFVAKDGGKNLRMCVDFRDLNALTIRDRFPLPRLDILLHKAAEAKIFSKLDLASGYHQIEVEPKHREFTSFILPEAVQGHALWEWKVMPFGW